MRLMGRLSQPLNGRDTNRNRDLPLDQDKIFFFFFVDFDEVRTHAWHVVVSEQPSNFFKIKI
jgi:hypothetical protein